MSIQIDLIDRQNFDKTLQSHDKLLNFAFKHLQKKQ